MTDITRRILMSLEAVGRPVTPEELRERGQMRYGVDLVRLQLDRLVELRQARRVNGSRYVCEAGDPAAQDTPPPATAPPARPAAKPGSILERILAALHEHGPLDNRGLGRVLGLPYKQVESNAYHMRQAGLVVRSPEGVYRPRGPDEAPDPAPAQRRWTAQEEAIVAECLDRGVSVRATRKTLHREGFVRAESAVKTKRGELLAQRRGAGKEERPWTPEEDAVLRMALARLRDEPEGLPLPEVMQHLAEAGSRRTAGAVRERLRHLAGQPVSHEETSMTQEKTPPAPAPPAADDPAAELAALGKAIATPRHVIEERARKLDVLRMVADTLRPRAPATAAVLEAVRGDIQRIAQEGGA